MRIGRTLPPAASPLTWRDLAAGLRGALRGSRETQRFTEELRAAFNQKHVFLVSSGKTALTLILQALKELRPECDRVLIPAYTCYSVPSAIVRAGLEVSLCDIDPHTLDFDMQQLPGKLCDPRLLCVVPVHLLGLPADVARLRSMIPDPEVFLVEDAAQAMGSTHDGRLLGTSGDAGFFSLGRGKALSTVEGGVILTDRADISAALQNQVEQLPTYSAKQTAVVLVYALALWLLIRPSLFWLPKALPCLRLGETIYDPHFPMRLFSGLQAGLARRWRNNLSVLQKTRIAGVDVWQKSLKPLGRGESMPLLRYPLLLENAAEVSRVVEKGEGQGLGIAPSYPDAVHRIADLAAKFSGEDYPAARDVARRLVTLPVHGFVRQVDQEQIVKTFSVAEAPGAAQIGFFRAKHE